MLCWEIKCCGFSFYVANQDIYVAVDTFQPPECLTQLVRHFWIPLSQQDVWCWDNQGTIQKKAEKKWGNSCVQLLTWCSLIVKRCSGSVLSNSQCRQLWGCGCPRLPWFSSCTMDGWNKQLSTYTWANAQELWAVVCSKLPLSHCPVWWEDFGFSTPLSGCTSELLLKVCCILRLT